jgi:hypothetical protein
MNRCVICNVVTEAGELCAPCDRSFGKHRLPPISTVSAVGLAIKLFFGLILIALALLVVLTLAVLWNGGVWGDIVQ